MNAKVAQPLNRLIILSLVAAISACVAPTRKTSGPAAGESSASLYILEGTARYAELEQKALQNLNTPSEHTTSNIAPLCVALSNLKKYRQLFQCLNELQSRVQRGDVTIRSDLFLLGLVDLSSDASAMPDALRGEALIDLGQYAESIKAGEAAWPAIKDTNSQGIWPPDRYRIMILSNLAHASALSGNREQALRYLAKLNDLSVQYAGSIGWKAQRREGNIKTLLALGKYAEAMKYLDDLEGRGGISGALVGFGNLLSGQVFQGESVMSFAEIPWLVMRGKALSELGKLRDAKLALDEAIAHKRFADFGDMAWLAYYERGRIAAKDNSPAEAIEYFKKAIEVFEQQRSSIDSEASKIGFVGDKQDVYARLVSHLIEAHQTAEAFDYVERAKARALVDLLASKQDFSMQSLNPEATRAILAKIDEADLASRVHDATAEAGSAVAVRNLTVARGELQSAAPELATLVTVSTVPVTELQNLLAEDETLVEYYQMGNNWAAFVLTRNRLAVIGIIGIGLRDQIERLRRGVEEPTSDLWRAPASQLYARLWKPLEGLGEMRRVIVVPHGLLHYLPFAALKKPDDTFLLDSVSLRLLPSASVLKYLKPASKRRTRMLLLGNPDLGDPKLDLVFAELEVRAIAALSPNSRILIRREASETNFKEAAPLFSRLHFATHGKFQAEDPLNSGLYLAKDANNDGVLTVGELYALNMDADLVTLSACETGLGKVANGDDVVGLTRGFLYAGARSIVGSLWSVDDKATGELMQSFYKNLRNLSKQEALRQAQIKTRQNFPHPFFWAAFELTGRSD